MNAFKDGLTVLNQTNMNELVKLQPFTLLYEGSVVGVKTGAGATENDVADNYFMISCVATGVSSISRALLKIAADGAGQDLTVDLIDSDFAADGSNDGTILKTIVIPKEHLPASAAIVQIPLGVSGLTPGANYWLRVSKVGDTTNHFHLIGEASADALYPVWRRAGTSGVWSANNAVHFAYYSGDTGVPVHEIYGANGYTTIEYSAGLPTRQLFYMPPADGAAGGIREILTLSYASGILTGGVVT